MRECYKSLIEEAEITNMGYREFLGYLLKNEEEGKKKRQHERLKRYAKFDMLKRLNDIDYSFNPSLDQSKIEDLGRLSFIEWMRMLL